MRDQLTELIQPVVEGLGCEFWGIERLTTLGSSTLKIYIDMEEGVDIEDCARVSRQVSGLLDVEEPLVGKYSLEVSSPGMDRRLFRLDQFEKFAGSNVKIRLTHPYDGQRSFSGQLKGIEGDEVVLDLNDRRILFPFEIIEKANIVPDFINARR